MMIHSRTEVSKMKRETKITLILLLLTAFLTLLSLPLLPKIGAQLNGLVTNTSLINVTVNVTNSAPAVISVTLQDPIQLAAYSNITITCNATVFDWDTEVHTVNATLFFMDGGYTAGTADDKNFHYTNASCINSSYIGVYTNFTCAFDIAFYAYNGSWQCNVSALDTGLASASNISVQAEVAPLIAMYVPMSSIDYGNLPSGNISETQNVSIINGGNMHINISLAAFENASGDDFQMNCSTAGKVAYGYQRYNISAPVDWNSMVSVRNVSTRANGLRVIRRENDQIDSTNLTYWKFKVPPNVAGVCLGYIQFTAEQG